MSSNPDDANCRFYDHVYSKPSGSSSIREALKGVAKDDVSTYTKMEQMLSLKDMMNNYPVISLFMINTNEINIDFISAFISSEESRTLFLLKDKDSLQHNQGTGVFFPIGDCVVGGAMMTHIILTMIVR